jgi:DNA-binding MarR family transcriptional regulator
MDMAAAPTDIEIAAVQALTRASRVLERASTELSLADFRVLSAIAGGDARASRVADRLAIGRPTISAAVESLVRRGLLDREVVKNDQRAASLSLTAAGRAARDGFELEMVERVRQLSARTPDPERLIESLAWLGAAIETSTAERIGAQA